MSNGRCTCGRATETSSGVCDACLAAGYHVGRVTFAPNSTPAMPTGSTGLAIELNLLKRQKAEADATLTRVKALVERWRAEGAAFRSMAGIHACGVEDGLRHCADELAHALDGPARRSSRERHEAEARTQADGSRRACYR